MKKKDIFTQAAEEKRQDFYYKPGEDGHGLYAIPINTEGLFNLSEEQLQELKIKHETIQKKLQNVGIQSTLKITSRGYSCLRIYKQETFKKLKTFIIQNNIPVMNRKWNKIEP